MPKPKRQKRGRFNPCELGFSHIDIAHLHTAKQRAYLFVAVDHLSKLAFARVYRRTTVTTAAAFLRVLIRSVAYRIHMVLTDNVPTTESRISVGRAHPGAAARLPSHLRSADSKHVCAVDFHEHRSPAHHSGRMIHPRQVVISVPQAA